MSNSLGSLVELKQLNAKMSMLILLYDSLEGMHSVDDVKHWVHDRRKEIMDQLGEI